MDKWSILNDVLSYHSGEDKLFVIKYPKGYTRIKSLPTPNGHILEAEVLFTDSGMYITKIMDKDVDTINNIIALSKHNNYKLPLITTRYAEEFSTFRKSLKNCYRIMSVKHAWYDIWLS